MIDLERERLLSFSQAAAILPGRPNVCSVFRWAQRGIKGHRLEVAKIGGRTFTSHEALQRFSDRITAASTGEPVPVRTPRQRERAIEAAERRLTEAGI